MLDQVYSTPGVNIEKILMKSELLDVSWLEIYFRIFQKIDNFSCHQIVKTWWYQILLCIGSTIFLESLSQSTIASNPMEFS